MIEGCKPFHQYHHHGLLRIMRRVVTSHCQAVLTEVTALNHEVLDDTVELRALVTKAFRKLSAILLNTGSQSTEVLDGLRDSLATNGVI